MREDIQKAIKEYEIATMPFFKKEAEASEKYLGTEEKVILCLDGNFCISYPDPTKKISLYGITLVTNKRVFIYYKPKKEGLIDEILLGEITDIKVFSPSLYDDHIQVYSADKIYDFPIRTKQKGLVISIAQSKQAAFAKIYRAFMFAINPNGFEITKNEAQKTEAPVTSDATDKSNIPEQIEKLAALKDKGIISEEEFQNKKTELLSRL